MALLWKMICTLRDPMSLRHPVTHISTFHCYICDTCTATCVRMTVGGTATLVRRCVTYVTHIANQCSSSPHCLTNVVEQKDLRELLHWFAICVTYVTHIRTSVAVPPTV